MLSLAIHQHAIVPRGAQHIAAPARMVVGEIARIEHQLSTVRPEHEVQLILVLMAGAERTGVEEQQPRVAVPAAPQGVVARIGKSVRLLRGKQIPTNLADTILAES